MIGRIFAPRKWHSRNDIPAVAVVVTLIDEVRTALVLALSHDGVR